MQFQRIMSVQRLVSYDLFKLRSRTLLLGVLNSQRCTYAGAKRKPSSMLLFAEFLEDQDGG